MTFNCGTAVHRVSLFLSWCLPVTASNVEIDGLLFYVEFLFGKSALDHIVALDAVA